MLLRLAGLEQRHTGREQGEAVGHLSAVAETVDALGLRLHRDHKCDADSRTHLTERVVDDTTQGEPMRWQTEDRHGRLCRERRAQADTWCTRVEGSELEAVSMP